MPETKQGEGKHEQQQDDNEKADSDRPPSNRPAPVPEKSTARRTALESIMVVVFIMVISWYVCVCLLKVVCERETSCCMTDCETGTPPFMREAPVYEGFPRL